MQDRVEQTAATDLTLCGAASNDWMNAATALSLTDSWSIVVCARGTWAGPFGAGHRSPSLVALLGYGPQAMEAGSSRERQGDESVFDFYRRRRTAALDRSAADTLTDLALTWGMAWVDIARILGVSVPAVRKWRLSSAQPRAVHRERLAVLAALLEAMKTLGTVEPAGRLNVRLLDAYSVTLADLVSPDNAEPILWHVSGEWPAERLLNEVAPGWEVDFRAQTDVYVTESGEQALRLRSRQP